ncbi:helix-turn-helix domain-containing protein [Beijerinckia mobilis]|uniref:helix-turn-helix domain-containing protein n=1 Tax=Beijerinckia mobilis TaxID=231434 RepID=UPI000554E5FC|nr:helix-turn-helix transcriptional regulator [Beijerinckia mobilis]
MRREVRRKKIYAGARLRRLRETRGIAQAELARRLAISASYLNQIENDHRPLTSANLESLCAIFGVEPDYFSDAEDLRHAADLREVSGDPFFGDRLVSPAEAEAAVRSSPQVVSRFLQLYRAWQTLNEENAALRRLEQDANVAEAVTPALPYDEVRDWVQSRRNYFDGLDRAGEELAEAQNFNSDTMKESLRNYLHRQHAIDVVTFSGLSEKGLVWQFDRGAKRLLVAAETTPQQQSFALAHVIGLLEQKAQIAKLVQTAGLTSDEARSLARIALANYFAGALILPYGRFLSEAQSVRYDIEKLRGRFGVTFEQVCHRLSTLQRPRASGIPFWFLKVDIAGNVLKRSSAARFQFARSGGSCPLWNVHHSFTQPGSLLVQLARTPDGITYLSIAKTVGAEATSYLARPRAVAVGLGCEIDYADRTVYATGLDLANHDIADPIGPGCRTCERPDCRHRSLPPLGKKLDVGSDERGVIPYRIEGES